MPTETPEALKHPDSLKHNAKIDVRLPDQLKDEFLERCKQNGVSSGAILRALITQHLDQKQTPHSRPVGRLESVIAKYSKWLLGGLGAAGAATLSAMALLFPPLATADETLGVAYRFVASQDAGTTWRTIGRWQTGEGAFEHIDVPELGLRIELQAFDCARAEVEECTNEQAYILLNIWHYEGELEASDFQFYSMGTRLEKGHSGSIDTAIAQGLRFDAVLTPIE